MDSATEDRQELVRNCQNFLVPDHEDGPYKRVLEHDVLTKEKLETGKLRLDIKLQDVQDYQQHLHQRLISDPEAVIRAFEIAVEDTVRNLFPKTLQEEQQIKVGIVGELGPQTVSPRALTSDHISKLVRVEGIVTKCSLVRPKIVKSVHYCEKTGQFTTKEFRDVTSTSGQPTGAVYPQRDDQGNPLTTEFGLCKYKDHQVVVVQELPETAPAGQMPCSTEASPALCYHGLCYCTHKLHLSMSGVSCSLLQARTSAVVTAEPAYIPYTGGGCGVYSWVVLGQSSFDCLFVMQIMLEDDLVDTCKPGGRISVVGVYKAVPPRATGAVSGVFKAVVVGNSVRQLSRESDRDLTADDIRCASSAEAPVPG